MVSKHYSKLGFVLAGCYLLLTVAVLLLNLALPDNDFWGATTFLLTFPWSLAVTLFMWTLAHNSAMYLVPVMLGACAFLNAGILYVAASSLSRLLNRR